MKPDVVRDAKDGGHGNRCVDVDDGLEAERRHICNLKKEAFDFEEGNGAISNPSTSSHTFIIPRQEREQPAPSKLSLGEMKRQSGIEICGSKRVCTIGRNLILYR